MIYFKRIFSFQPTLLATTLLYFVCSTVLLAQHNWIRSNPGGGGAIAMVGATANGTLLAASDLSGVYRSFDDGAHWDVLGANNGLIATHTSALGFHTADGNTFFVGTGDGLYKTTNGGENFLRVLPDTNNRYKVEYIESIVVAKSNPNIVYVTQHEWDTTKPSDIYKSTDGGTHWQVALGVGLPNYLHMIKLLVHPSNANIVYALTGKSRWGCSPARLYKSIDGGTNWIQLGSSLWDILDMDIHPTDTNTVFISTFEANACPAVLPENYEYNKGDENSGAFYKSSNGGSSFTQLSDKTGIISVGINNPDTIRLVDILFPFDWNDNAGTWESTDAGQSWTHTGLVENWLTGYTNNQYYAYTLTFNGLSKTLTKDIFNADRLYGSFGQWAWGTFDGGRHLNNISTKAVGTTGDRWLSTGVENIIGHALDVSDSNPDIIYMGGYDIGFWYSTDHGGSWTRSQPNYNLYSEYVWNIGDDFPVDQQFAIRGEGANTSTILNDPAREGVVWVSFSKGQYSDETEGIISKTGLFKSIAYGENLELISNGLPTGDNSIRMYGLSLNINSPINNRTLYMTVKGDVYKSSNDGQSWSIVFANKELNFTEVDKFDGNLIYAGGKGGLWRSTNAGIDWTEVGLPEMRGDHSPMRKDIVPTDSVIDWSTGEAVTTLYAWEGVFDIQTDPNIANRLYVTALGNGKGLYRSDDAGATWTKLMTDRSMRGVAIAPQDSNLIYATSSQSYHSGGTGNSLGILYSSDAGTSWQEANNGMAWNYGGMIEIETGINPNVWAWSPGTGLQYSPAELAPVVACDITTAVLNLPTGQWHQISLPCAPPSNAKTVQAVFGDDITGAYGIDWIVYSYNPNNNTYTEVGLEDDLAQGVGYWVIQRTALAVTLDFPAGSTQTTHILSEQCVSSNGCYSVPLSTKAETVQWNMSGYPFLKNVTLDRFRIVTDSGRCVNGCTLDEAKEFGIVENTLWSYNGESYNAIRGRHSVNAWSGFWIAALASGNELNLRLEIPVD